MLWWVADYPLSDDGRKTALEIADKLSLFSIDKIYSSPLKRAKETAEVIDSLKRCGITTILNLKERNSYGVLSGCEKEECKEIYGHLLSDLKNKPGDYYSDELVLGAEEKQVFDKRVEEALNDIITNALDNGYENVVVVTHSNVTRSIYKNILNIKNKIDLDLLATSTIEYQNNIYTLVSNEGVYEG